MNLLIDTHAFLWYIQANKQLSPKTADILESPNHNLYFSIASLWEVSIKMGLDKLKLESPFHELEALLSRLSIEISPITFADTKTYLDLPLHHRDPFDRILIAQAINRSLSVVTGDSAFDAYSIKRVWP